MEEYDLAGEFNSLLGLSGKEKDKAEKKRLLHALFKRYGESVRDIENRADNEEYWQYLRAREYADEVLSERRQKRIENERKESLLKRDNGKLMRDEIMVRKREKEDEELSEASKNLCEDKEELLHEYHREFERYLSSADVSVGRDESTLHIPQSSGEKMRVDINKRRERSLEEDIRMSQYNDTGRELARAYRNLNQVRLKREMDAKVRESMSEVEILARRRKVRSDRTKIRVNGVLKMLPATNFAEDEDFTSQLGGFEGFSLYPYLDSENIYTIGGGINIMDNFYDYPWEDKEGNRITDKRILEREKAKLDEIYVYQENLMKKYSRKEYSKYMRSAKSFEKETILRLPESFLKELRRRKIQEMEAELQTNIENYNRENSERYGRRILDLDEMPREYAKTLLELKYNLGGGAFNTKSFKNLFLGLIKGDKEMILSHLRRFENNDNDRKRNDWARKLLDDTDELPSVPIKKSVLETVG